MGPDGDELLSDVAGACAAEVCSILRPVKPPVPCARTHSSELATGRNFQMPFKGVGLKMPCTSVIDLAFVCNAAQLWRLLTSTALKNGRQKCGNSSRISNTVQYTHVLIHGLPFVSKAAWRWWATLTFALQAFLAFISRSRSRLGRPAAFHANNHL